MRDGCNFRSRRAGRSATINADYRNYRCPISDVCLCSRYVTSYVRRSKVAVADPPRLFCIGYGGGGCNNKLWINHFRILSYT